MFTFLRATVFAIISLMLVACNTVQIGRDFDVHTPDSKFERGVTTQNQVRAWLGEPSSVGISVDTSGERLDEWTYYFASGNLPDMKDAKVKILQVKFDKRGAISSYNWSASVQ